jgi:hypothetical protein
MAKVMGGLTPEQLIYNVTLGPTFGPLFDPIGPYISGITAGAALWSPGTWPAASAIGQAQAQAWANQLAFAQSSGSSASAFTNTLSSIVNWAQSSIF